LSERLQIAASVLGLKVRALADRREIVDRGGKATCAQANVQIVNKLRVQYSREIVGPRRPQARLAEGGEVREQALAQKGVLT